MRRQHSEFYDRYVRSPEWAEKKRQRLEIDGRRCVMCGRGESETGLQVHHISYQNLGAEDVMTDLVTVCGSCHRKLHRYLQRRTE